jgi:hypothetical protein
MFVSSENMEIKILLMGIKLGLQTYGNTNGGEFETRKLRKILRPKRELLI